MTLAKAPAPIEVINDINGEIVNFYQQLRDNENELLRRIELTPYARAELENARNRARARSKVERARRFFVTAMMAVNGSFGEAKGGFSVSHAYSRSGMEARVNRWNRMYEYLLTVVDRLKRVRIENRDALVLFREFRNRPGTLVYLDPPYLAKRQGGYDHDENSEEFHEKLLKAAMKAKCMVFISGYASELYNDLLTAKHGWRKRTIEAITKGNNGKCFSRTEVIWFNSVYREAKRTGQVPITLRKKEERNIKVNPIR